jgi:ribonuclease-3 family protein
MNYNLKHYSYIGDCVWELFVREHVIQKTQNLKDMHSLSTKYVCAEFQADIINKIMDKLQDDEIDIQHRSRNLKMTINKKSNPHIHSLATSFESVIGYLYLENKPRLDEILKIIEKELNNFT